ncbi:YihY/virulence factor BrkB family protein [Carboxylicivirga sp. A043]|uniref:YihY/virulence factor BrkB family protein n=1 Tax=Carboxylicivirga litoralis TaxID=2816963 RepID=UPI0021CB3986|nr:YihY/virulence factor BrkB family protein [Carboxylicivirga sp. A043]MCU4155775.1 YihY/virulence factor BrkB family protein [Carboxylicivirga sp. A043]
MMIKDLYEKVKYYLHEDLWRVRADKTTRRQFFLIRILRIIYIAIKGFIQDSCPQKASALSFYSMLSIVPITALAFAIAKGFGVNDKLELLMETRLEGQEEIWHKVAEFGLNYLEKTRGGELAGVGLGVLLWSVIQIFSNVEISFNDIWKVKHPRGLLRKFSDFISLSFVGILFLTSMSGMIMFVTKQLESWGFHYGLFVPISSFLILWIIFTLLVSIMPNAGVKTKSALFGAFVTAIMFQILQHSFIEIMHRVTSYNLVYGGFAALPLFILWMQTSWLIVLFGAELTFAHQNAHSFEFESDIKNISHSYRRLLLILITERIVKRFDNEEEPYDNQELSLELKLPVRLVNELLNQLIECKIISEIYYQGAEDTFYQPASSISKLTVLKVINLVDHYGTTDFHYESSEHFDKMKDVLEQMNRRLDSSRTNKLLKDL